jgi:hypothetical protein
METAAYIIVGAICERITFWAFILAELFIGGLLYPTFGCWVWGGGWLSKLGQTMGFGSRVRGFRRFDGSPWGRRLLRYGACSHPRSPGWGNMVRTGSRGLFLHITLCMS